jgi:hypothetical protein
MYLHTFVEETHLAEALAFNNNNNNNKKRKAILVTGRGGP